MIVIADVPGSVPAADETATSARYFELISPSIALTRSYFVSGSSLVNGHAEISHSGEADLAQVVKQSSNMLGIVDDISFMLILEKPMSSVADTAATLL